MEELNKHILIEILKYFPIKELPRLILISKSFYSAGTSDYLWKEACSLLFPEIKLSFYSNFLSFIPIFLKISNSFYEILNQASKSSQKLLYFRMISQSNPILGSIIPKYHYSLKGQNPFKSYSDYYNLTGSNNNELYWVYLLYNGQSDQPGFFGSYEFYDVNVNMKFLFARKINKFHVLASNVADRDPNLFIDMENAIGKGSGALFLNSAVNQSALYISPNISTYLQSYSDKIKTNKIEMKYENFQLYEANSYSSVNCEHGISIAAKALYVSHLSRTGRHLWTYQITIGPNNPTKSWKLMTRSWKITDSDGKIQTVDRQPGVIGLYPIVSSNSQPVTYTSCSYLNTTSGVMSGFFSFFNMDNQDECVDIAVNPFRLELPEGSELVDISFLN